MRRKSDFNAITVTGRTGARRGPLEYGKSSERSRGGARPPRPAVAKGRSDASNRPYFLFSLQSPPLIHARGQPCEIESRGRKAGVPRTVLDESVGNTDLQHRDLYAGGCEQFTDGGACTAHDGVFFYGHERAVPSCQADDERSIERFDEAHVDKRGVQPLGDLAGRLEQSAENKYCQATAALASHLSTAHGERRHFRDDGNAESRASGIAHGRGRCKGCCRVQHLPTLVLIRW